MQSFGFISPYWIKHNATSECFRGVVRNSKCPDNVEGRNILIIFQNEQNICFTFVIKLLLNFALQQIYYFKGLGAAVYGLQTTSFVIIALTSISAVYLICCSSDDGDKDEVAGGFALFVGCLVCLYPVAG